MMLSSWLHMANILFINLDTCNLENIYNVATIPPQKKSYKIIPDFISNTKHVSAKIQEFLNSQYVKNIYKIVKYKTI